MDRLCFFMLATALLWGSAAEASLSSKLKPLVTVPTATSSSSTGSSTATSEAPLNRAWLLTQSALQFLSFPIAVGSGVAGWFRTDSVATAFKVVCIVSIVAHGAGGAMAVAYWPNL